MLEKKKKFSKKEIKEDQLVTSYYKATKFFEEYQSKIYIGLVAVAVIIGAIVLYSNKLESDNLDASGALAKVLPLYEMGSYKEAIEGTPAADILGLKAIAGKFGGTEQGEMAKVYLGHAYYFSGDFDNAEDAYGDYSGDNKDMAATCIAGKAGCAVAKSDYKSAASLFEKAANVSKYNPLNAEYLVKAAANYIKAGDKEEAEELLKIVKNDYKTTRMAGEADKYLALVK